MRQGSPKSRWFRFSSVIQIKPFRYMDDPWRNTPVFLSKPDSYNFEALRSLWMRLGDITQVANRDVFDQ